MEPDHTSLDGAWLRRKNTVMISNRRQRLDRLASYVAEAEETSIEALAEAFGVSSATIRRDVKLLESEGSLVQTVGGGVLRRTSVSEHADEDHEAVRNIEAKIRIGEYCASLVEEHDEIIVGPGTTTLIVGRILSGVRDKDFRLITNALDLAIETSGVENIETVVLGGEVEGHYSKGFTAHEDFFSTCHSRHKLILSADGVDPTEGITQFQSRFVDLLKKMMSVSSTIYLVADSSKIEKACFNQVAPIDSVDVFVTDTGAPTGFCRRLDTSGVKVVRV